MTDILYGLSLQPVASELREELLDLSLAVFGSEDRLDGGWRIDNMPDLTCFEARAGARLVGFKLGYAVTSRRYYSWLGGVHPHYRRLGIARELMTNQHDWLRGRGYQQVETETVNSNHEMAHLNTTAGFLAVGIRYTAGDPRIIFRKSLES